jgi:hypothetical protein
VQSPAAALRVQIGQQACEQHTELTSRDDAAEHLHKGGHCVRENTAVSLVANWL